MQCGVVDFWQAKKRFGFVSSTLPSGEVRRYFLGSRQIKFIAPGTVLGIGCGVVFEPSAFTPGKSGAMPPATNVRVHKDELSALIEFAEAASPEGERP